MKSTSMDALYSQVAKKVLKESIKLKKGESITIESWNNGLPFARHVVMEARRMGAIPMVVFEDEDAYVDGVKNAPEEMLGKMGKQEYRLISGSDAYVFIPGPILGSFSHRLTREQTQRSTQYNQSWYKAAAKSKLRGVRLTFGYIGADAEQTLGRSVEATVAHQLAAALADYRVVGKKAKELKAALKKAGTEVTITTPGSRLKLQVNGTLEVEDGVVDAADIANDSNITYVPPGYVYAETIPESVSGTFTFSPIVTRFGLIDGGTAEFRGGELVSISSDASKSALAKLMEAAPKNSNRASSVMIGLNPLLKYGYGQNANAGGVVGIRALGVNLTAKAPSLRTKEKTLISRGRLYL